MNNIEEAWDTLTEQGIATEEELQLVTGINGYSIEALEEVLYYRTGLRGFDQLEDTWREDY